MSLTYIPLYRMRPLTNNKPPLHLSRIPIRGRESVCRRGPGKRNRVVNWIRFTSGGMAGASAVAPR